MSTLTAGTQAQTTLTALFFARAGLVAADLATVSGAIKPDVGATSEFIGYTANQGEAFAHNGTLWIPGRGKLQVRPGDLVAVDPLGWPILISAASAGNSSYWIHT